MKKLIVLVTLLFVAVIGASASPMCVNGGTLASYQGLALGGCFYNDLFLSNFNYSVSGVGSTVPGGSQGIANTAVAVKLVNNGVGGVGLDFSGAFNLNGVSTSASNTITYTITYTVAAPVSYFKGVSAVVLNASVDTENTGTLSAISFSKSLKNGTGCTGTYAACGGLLATSPSLNVALNDPTNNATPVTSPSLSLLKNPFSTGLTYSTLYINDQLTLTASKNAGPTVKGNAQITDMENFFVVPEPGTGLLGGSIGLGLILLSRLRRKKT